MTAGAPGSAISKIDDASPDIGSAYPHPKRPNVPGYRSALRHSSRQTNGWTRHWCSPPSWAARWTVWPPDWASRTPARTDGCVRVGVWVGVRSLKTQTGWLRILFEATPELLFLGRADRI